MKRPVFVIKSSGEKELFSEKKYRASLRRVGCSGKLVNDVFNKIYPQLKDGMTTREIFKKTWKILKKRECDVAGHYNLKTALLKFGPSGYPFENFIAALLSRQGYKVKLSKIIPGKCVNHEVDVVATKGKEKIMVECKFHNKARYRSNVKTSLYVKSRFDDIRHMTLEQKFTKCFFVTNTKFTSEAIKYGECAGIRMLSWGYPKGNALLELIREFKMHPISCLGVLNKKELDLTLRKGVILCRDILKKKELLTQFGFGRRKNKQIFDECKDFDGHHKK